MSSANESCGGAPIAWFPSMTCTYQGLAVGGRDGVDAVEAVEVGGAGHDGVRHVLVVGEEVVVLAAELDAARRGLAAEALLDGDVRRIEDGVDGVPIGRRELGVVREL